MRTNRPTGPDVSDVPKPCRKDDPTHEFWVDTGSSLEDPVPLRTGVGLTLGVGTPTPAVGEGLRRVTGLGVAPDPRDTWPSTRGATPVLGPGLFAGLVEFTPRGSGVRNVSRFNHSMGFVQLM